MKMNRITSKIIILLSCTLFSSLGGTAQHWSIENIAGDGSNSFIDGNPPLENGFRTPKAMAIDSENNIYFTSFDLVSGVYIGSIYKLSADYTVLEEIVEDVTPLTGIAIDKANNLYFSKGVGGIDVYSEEYIHKRAPDGVITAIAGNGLDEAGDYPEDGETALGHPIGNAGSLKIFTDELGVEWLYYSATLEDNNFIQKINLSSGLTFRVAGVPFTFDAGTYIGLDPAADAITSFLSMTLGLGFDSKGNVYYCTGASGADAYSIKKIIDGKIYHVAGNGVGEHTGDGGLAKYAGLATNTSGFIIVDDRMYVCDLGNNVIRTIELSTTIEDDGIIDKIAGTGYDEDDDEADVAKNITGTEIQAAVETNMEVIDIVYIDETFILSDLNARIRKLYWCKNPTQEPITISKDVLCKGDSVKLSFTGYLSGAEYWRWYEGGCHKDDSFIGSGTALNIVVDESTTYYAVGMGGCSYLTECEEISIDVNCKNYYNALTPNMDGKNDFLEIPVLSNYPTNTVTVYNRWGDFLTEIKDYDNSSAVWSGTNDNGDLVDSGTYFFTAVSGSEVIVSGWIQVIRD